MNIFYQILVWAVPVLPAIILHEIAHGWMAGLLGDTTARDEGRLSLNPIRHIDPFGTILLPGILLLLHAPFVFGWAKPVPVNFARLSNKRWGTLLVAMAGPGANMIMLAVWLALAHALGARLAMLEVAPASGYELLAHMALAGVGINLALMLLNLFPILPLDGGRILGSLLPEALAQAYQRLERFGIIILLILFATGLFGDILGDLLEFFFSHLGLI